MPALDAFDWRLLEALQQDASLTNGALAEKIGLSASQVSRRRQRLEQEGVVRGYRALIDPEAIGLSVTVFIHVALNTLTNYVNEVAGTEVDFPPVARAA